MSSLVGIGAAASLTAALAEAMTEGKRPVTRADIETVMSDPETEAAVEALRERTQRALAGPRPPLIRRGLPGRTP